MRVQHVLGDFLVKFGSSVELFVYLVELMPIKQHGSLKTESQKVRWNKQVLKYLPETDQLGDRVDVEVQFIPVPVF